MKMQTLRKKTSPLKYKNETTRFLGDGVSFKAKLIGILEVSEARGDRMCQEALSDLKMAIRAAGEHKQRITINIAIDGLRLRDEKTGDSLYHHPVHKISFIAQDMTDSRAFGYIFGSPDTGHRFFGIKTDKAASQVVITMRDLFQVVFALKKKEIELAKQHLDKSRFIASSPFTDTLLSTTKSTTQEVSKTATSESKTTSNAENRMEGTAVADLVDLELELNSLQQGINQMQRITPSDNFASKDDPFGDSFINYTKPMLPPPPSSGKEKSRRSETTSVPSPLNISDSFSETPPAYNKNKKNTFSQQSVDSYKIFPAADWATDSQTKKVDEDKKKDEAHEASKKEILSHFDVFVELDPLGEARSREKPISFGFTGTGKVKPYVDKKLFFQELKNPPKKVLKDLVAQDKKASPEKLSFPNEFGMDSFSEDPFVVEDPFPQVEFTRTDSFKTQPSDMPFSVAPNFPDANLQWNQRIIFPQNPIDRANQLKKFGHEEKKVHQPYDNLEQEEIAPEPPPKPGTMPLETPPMLPPKKQEISPKKRLEQISFDTFNISPLNQLQSTKKDESKRYEVLSNFGTSLDLGTSKPEVVSTSPKSQNFEDSGQILLPPPQRLSKRTPSQDAPSKSKETLNISSLESLNVNLSELTISDLNELTSKLNIPASELNNMTLAQLTNYITNFVKFKTSVENTSGQAQVGVNANTTPTFVADFAANFSDQNVTESKPPTDDRYAVFRELINEEIKQVETSAQNPEVGEEKSIQNEPQETKPPTSGIFANDKYAALREIVEKELKLNNEEEPKQSIPENKNWDDMEAPVDDSNVSFADDKTLEVSKSENELKKTVETVKNGDSIKSPVMLPSNSTVVEGSSLQNNFQPKSESLSDIASGSSPEMANSCSNSEVRKSMQDTSGENWVVFEQEAMKPSIKGKPSQNEEGVSPWSSDSKEFGNGSPQEWQCVVDSENGGDGKPRQGWEEWWDESEQVKGHYPNVCGSKHGGYGTGKRRKHASHFCDGQAAGQSSSSRDVSPWEDEPRGDTRCKKYTRRHSLEKHRDRRQPSEWDDDEDYDYNEERARFHRSAREKWEHDRKFYATEFSNWSGDWSDEKRHRHRREGDRERWCCPDSSSRYSGGRYFPPNADGHPGHWFDRKFENRYYSRESQESSWEEDYLNEEEEVPSPHYVTTKRVTKRPSSASEMDRKTGEIRLRHYFQPGGSDGERDRRFKPGRRSRSRDSQCSEPLHRRKAEMPRSIHRNKQYYPQQFENNFSDVMSKPKMDNSKIDGTKFETMRISNKKQMKQSLDKGLGHTLPRKSSQSASSFENDFVVEHSRISGEPEPDTSEPENDSPTVDKKFAKSYIFGKDQGNNPIHSEECTPRASLARRIHMENKARAPPQGDEDFFQEGGPDLFKMLGQTHDELENKQVRCAEEAKMKAFRQAMANNGQGNFHIKKSESVNIFACESDPFDDDFFSENANYDGKHTRENRC